MITRIAMLVAFAIAASATSAAALNTPAPPPEIGDPAATIDFELETIETLETILDNNGFDTSAEPETIEAVTTVGFGPLTIELPEDIDGAATSMGPTVLNGTNINGDQTIITNDAFAIITNNHTQQTHRYPVTATPGHTLTNNADGSITVTNTTGETIGTLNPAYAIDQTGQHHPATYHYDHTTNELVLTADLTEAEGLVIIDPSWGCKLKLIALGVLFLLAIVAWFGGAWWAMYLYLRVMPFLSSSTAWSIARSCA